MLLALSIFFELVYPNQTFALTGGPAQPEFNSFTPIGTSDMVDLSSGDMSYNIPLMDVGGYPLNIAYSAGVTMDQEASWVGLGWNLSVGQINRNVRGIPDDFDGDLITYENHMKPNITVGANLKISKAAFGVPLDFGAAANFDDLGNALPDDDLTFGVAVSYNNYSGFMMKPSVGVNIDLGQAVSVGFNAESGPDGLSVSPSVSLHSRDKDSKNRTNDLSANFGVSMNSRQGLTSATLSVSKKNYAAKVKEAAKVKKADIDRTQSLGSSIGFTDQLYTPNKRTAMSTKTFTVNMTLGSGTELFGGELQGQITAYGTVTKVANSDLEKKSPAYGYSNTEKAKITGILDFNREKDGGVSVNTTNLPITNYTYDIYSVQGQGVGGQYRPFRNQVGYVYDPFVKDLSMSGTLGLEFGVGNAVHNGADFEASIINGQSGRWTDNNFILQWLEEDNANFSPDYEKVHYKNVGDLSADQDYLDNADMFTRQGGYQATRVAWGGSEFNRTALDRFMMKTDGEGSENQMVVGSAIHRSQRLMRNQTIVNLTKAEVDNGIGYGPCVNNAIGVEYALPVEAKAHHVAEVQILRNDGARYIYGLPAYNKIKREATFSVQKNGDCATGLVGYSQDQVENPETLPNDQFLDRTTTPGYAHTHLLTSVLSTDYVDRENNGPTPDDFGSYTKFDYINYQDISGLPSYKWRVPYTGATHNQGLLSDDEDDRGNYIYGEKEMMFVKKISTKTHVATFEYSPRKDAHGVKDESGGFEASMNSYKLNRIKLYSIEEYYSVNDPGNQIVNASAIPIKTVHFEYDYDLCKGIPNNEAATPGQTTPLADGDLANQGGKLTLKRIYFTYRNSNMGKYTDYEFTYSASNPNYHIKGYDSWGNYKPTSNDCSNTGEISASEFPFTEQDQTIQNDRAEAWSLKQIELPSGGTISVSYESDDYAFVQDKATMRMFNVVGAGNSPVPVLADVDNADLSAELFGNQAINKAKRYLYISVDADPDHTASDYLRNPTDSLVYFRFFMNMTPQGNTGSSSILNASKFDYVTGYFQYRTEDLYQDGYSGDATIVVDPGDPTRRILSIPVDIVEKEGGWFDGTPLTNMVHPISKASWQFGQKYLNKHVFSNQPNGDTDDIMEIVIDLLSPQVINNLREVFVGPNATLENKNIGRRFIKKKSWVRLINPKKTKLGGGCRVKEIRMNDVWSDMNGTGNYQEMNYGQSYSYKLKNSDITSGVASYEPVGNKENPFVQPVFSSTKHLLAPDEHNFVEMPFGESFFPSPTVTYSRVQVANLVAGVAPTFDDNGTLTDKVINRLHRSGSVVTEFFTTRDYPTIVDQTIIDAEEDKNEILDNILKLNVRKHFTASQGYVVHLNDMNGKQKAQWVYAEGQDAPISGVEYHYDNHATQDGFSAAEYPQRNKGKLNNEVVVIHSDGAVTKQTIGVEVDLVNDLRENSTKTRIPGVNANLANFLLGIYVVVPAVLPDYSQTEDKFRSISTTKVINTFGILKETVAYDAGASVSTRNLAWDAQTGEVLLTETVDEFSDRYYTMNYPAHWFYKGMAQASNNIGFEGAVSGSGSGQYILTLPANTYAEDFLIPGDEVYGIVGGNYVKGWVSDVPPGTSNTFNLIDINGSGLDGLTEIKVIRSGHRNLQSAGIMNVTLMKNPLLQFLDGSGNVLPDSKLGLDFMNPVSDDWANWKIINAGAVDYSEDWFVGCECGVAASTGISNPYTINEKGVWRTKSSRTYLTGRNNATLTTPEQEGFFMNFAPMYQVDGGDWNKDFTNWTFVAEVTQYSPYGFELENKDALNRYSAAQYGYNNTFPMAVGANTQYREIGFDGFEDHLFNGCDYSPHFRFDSQIGLSSDESHTGKYSLRVGPNSRVTMDKKLDCDKSSPGEN